MVERPYVLLSVAMSLDGYIDDATDERLLLSNDEDLDRVDAVRASCDAVLVGAGTLRADNPRLELRSPARRADRVDRGVPEGPLKVTVTATGDVDPAARFFTAGAGLKLVYTATPAVAPARARLGDLAVVVDAGDPVDLHRMLADLATRGVERLMVEGGTRTSTWFLAAGLVDELHLAVAPFFVGDPHAPRFVGPAAFPHDLAHPLSLDEVRSLGDVVLLVYRSRYGTRDVQ